MDKLKAAIELRWKYNRMSFEDFIKEVEEHLGEKVTDEVKEFWRPIGLNNTDFFEMYVMTDNLEKSIEKHNS